MTKEKSALDKLCDLIKEGFREYDGDIREEAMELLESVKHQYQHSVSQQNLLVDELARITKENCQLHEKLSSLAPAEFIQDYHVCIVDFGTFKLHVAYEKQSPLACTELIDALNSVAMIIPVPKITNAVKRLNS